MSVSSWRQAPIMMGDITTSRGPVKMFRTRNPLRQGDLYLETYVALAHWMPTHLPVVMFVDALLLRDDRTDVNLVYAPELSRFRPAEDGGTRAYRSRLVDGSSIMDTSLTTRRIGPMPGTGGRAGSVGSCRLAVKMMTQRGQRQRKQSLGPKRLSGLQNSRHGEVFHLVGGWPLML
jgi:hypothetical protein